jgi:peptidoglycan/xylan/chitin deacetylase (PgdA/CDA1 family)
VLEEALLPAAAAVGFAAYAVRGKSSQLIAPSVWHGNRNRPSVALTFDDGPSESTPALLELLAEHDVKATFFMCGQNVRRLKEIAREVGAAGH